MQRYLQTKSTAIEMQQQQQQQQQQSINDHTEKPTLQQCLHSTKLNCK
jgi:hypothetical protein